jgi:asparagine synthase (glutamine-hydrolysing)
VADAGRLMCGIFGQFARAGALGEIEPLLAATNQLSHRGPDDAAWWSDGPFFFGHRRLSIIDIKCGQQPMATPDGRYVIVFNGEIYNYVELRQELSALGSTFSTESDTEVLLRGYETWGVKLPERLVGMFAFAIADRSQQSLFLARDRFGEKPLFLSETNGVLSFGSEVRALAGLPQTSREIDPQALGEYLCLNYVPGDRTMLSAVQRLPAAAWRLYSRSHVTEGVYWRPPAARSGSLGMEEAVGRLTSALDDGVRMALRSDVPVALMLSGGIDSSIVAESAVRQGRLSCAYCLDFPAAGFSEVDKASAVARRLGVELRRVELTSDALNNFMELVQHADDPLADSSAVAVWTLAEAIARDYKVVISGDGGDELFGGYLTYKASEFHRRLIRPLPHGVRRFIAGAAGWIPVTSGKVSTTYQAMRFMRAAPLDTAEAHLTWNGTWMPQDAAAFTTLPAAADAARGALRGLAARYGLERAPNTSALQRLDAAEYLTNDILTKVDRMTMAHGLEARAPLLVPAVADLAFSLPDDLKITLAGQPKRLLRELVKRLYGPELARAPKKGFSIPVHDWLRGPARALANELLSPSEVKRTGVLDAGAVQRAWITHQSGKAQLGFELWGLMVLVAWHGVRVATRPAAQGSGLRRVDIPRKPEGPSCAR